MFTLYLPDLEKETESPEKLTETVLRNAI